VVTPEEVDDTAVCVDVCGSRCCSGGAFLRPADEASLQDAGVDDPGAESRPMTRTGEDGDCVHLGEDGRCAVYDDRPLDCRLFPLGFRLDDETRQVEVTLAACPLAETIPDRAAADLIRRARRLLGEFDEPTLRAYDGLPFTTDVTTIETIPYDETPIDL